MPELTKKQFDLIAKLIQSKEPARTAAFLVLVKGKGNQDAIAETGLSKQSVSNVLGRFRRTHKEICSVYAK
ncbi:MAG: TrfB-related DNA-binding protein [Sideroxydans sp.]|nr:TrfB-related DNA-binding protein [Sideroxydans sp.]MDD5056603.1 TrfB-related DNA-binding protein [Sideroxydans sp.]